MKLVGVLLAVGILSACSKPVDLDYKKAYDEHIATCSVTRIVAIIEECEKGNREACSAKYRFTGLVEGDSVANYFSGKKRKVCPSLAEIRPRLL